VPQRQYYPSGEKGEKPRGAREGYGGTLARAWVNPMWCKGNGTASRIRVTASERRIPRTRLRATEAHREMRAEIQNPAYYFRGAF